jgi:hypothetical protein
MRERERDRANRDTSILDRKSTRWASTVPKSFDSERVNPHRTRSGPFEPLRSFFPGSCKYISKVLYVSNFARNNGTSEDGRPRQQQAKKTGTGNLQICQRKPRRTVKAARGMLRGDTTRHSARKQAWWTRERRYYVTQHTTKSAMIRE